MGKPRTLVPIPRQPAAAIDKVGGRSSATRSGKLQGSWKDEDHPELADGADKWVRQMRQESAKRFEKIERHRLP